MNYINHFLTLPFLQKKIASSANPLKINEFIYQSYTFYMLRNCCSCSLIRFSTSLYCLTLSPLLLCSMGARGWPESHRWSCGWRAHLRPITTLFESNQYLQITSQSVLLQQAIAVVAMASVVLCFSSKVLQVDFKSATLLFHGLPLLALQEKSQILGRVWTKIPKKGRQLLFLSDISMQIARVQCARYPCNKKNSRKCLFFPKKCRKESSTNQQTKLKIYKLFK